MKYLYVILVFVLLFSVSCISRRSNNYLSQKTDSSFVVPLAPIEKKPIIFNSPPTESDIDSFIVNKTPESFKNLWYHYNEADLLFEILFFAFVAADKFEITKGYLEIAGCLTNYFTYMSIGGHSKEIATHYLRKGANKSKSCAETYKSLSFVKQDAKLWLPEKHKGNSILTLKVNSLLGNIDDYIKLKKYLIENNQSELLLYYSYIMADRYNYKPANKDINDIFKINYQKYGLGTFGEDTKYFCCFFQ